jgi:fructokinase
MRIGIDLGGTKIEGIVMNEAGQIIQQHRIPTPAAEGYLAVVKAIASVVEHLEKQVGRKCTVGIGTPGAISARTGLLKNSNSTSLNGQPLLEDLKQAMNRDIRMANDANCFALSEAQDGAAAGYEVVFGVILGTGVGGGVIYSRQAHNGPNSIAGEWGHTPLLDSGPACYCGKRGCVETLLSGPAFFKDYVLGGGTQAPDTAGVVTGASNNSDPFAVQAMDRYIQRFGRALATVIDILDPDAIVLGGGLSNIDILYTRGRDSVIEHVFSDDLRTPIMRNKYGDSSGVRGAAWLW